MRRILPYVFLLLAVACEKVDLTKEETTGGNVEWSGPPIGTGEGTAQKPYTVEEIQTLPMGETGQCWVIGYVVGATYRSMNEAMFTSATSYTSNILLSGDSLCEDIRNCIPVELNGKKMQKAFALPQNPAGFRQCAVFHGTAARYFSKNGLREIDAGHWLLGFDIQAICPTPQEWEDTVIVLR